MFRSRDIYAEREREKGENGQGVIGLSLRSLHLQFSGNRHGREESFCWYGREEEEHDSIVLRLASRVFCAKFILNEV